MNFRKLSHILLPLLIFFGLQADIIEGFIQQQTLQQCSVSKHKKTKQNQDDPDDDAAIVRKVNLPQTFIIEPFTPLEDRVAVNYPSLITGHHACPVNARAMQEVCFGLLFLQHLF
jgi:hypothetical protein